MPTARQETRDDRVRRRARRRCRPLGTLGAGALQGVRVLELGQLIAGPFCGQLLGDLGADVIKIEPPVTGDPLRTWRRLNGDGPSLWWPIIARNKRSITLDLRRAEGQALAARLIRGADVLIENFRPGTMEKWNLGYEQLAQENVGLIMVRMSGFGQSGPYRDQAGFGSIGEAMGGIRYVTGFPDRPPPRVGVSIGDSLTALFGAIGVLSAVNARAQSGRGQVVDAALYESVLGIMECLITEFDKTGVVRERSGSILPGVAPSNVYPCADGLDIVIGANGNGVFRRLCDAMGRPDLADPGAFGSSEQRGVRRRARPADRRVDFAAHERRGARADAGLVRTGGHDLSRAGNARGPALRRTRGDRRSGRRRARQAQDAERVSAAFGTPGEVRWAGPALGEVRWLGPRARRAHRRGVHRASRLHAGGRRAAALGRRDLPAHLRRERTPMTDEFTAAGYSSHDIGFGRRAAMLVSTSSAR